MLDATEAAPSGSAAAETAEALVLGAGFAGLCSAIQLRAHGISNVLILEKADDIGGTWRDNTYPGCACDVPSHLYSLSFAPKHDWTRMYASQPEIWAYLRQVVADHGLTPLIRFGAKVQDLTWNEAEALWHVRTTDGRRFAARFVFFGLGPLHIPSYPEIPGRDAFAGPQFHSALWDHATDLRGKRVAVIGTGASAIQFIPEIAPLAAHLTVFQRTPPWVLPRQDYAFSPAQRRRLRHPLRRRLFRTRIFLAHELRVLGFLGNRTVARAGERMARAHLAAQIKDPVLRAKLTPSYAMGCKRVLISNDFYPSLARGNVTLETAPIREIRSNSILTADGAEHAADILIYGTGFHTTDAFEAVPVTGRHGSTLREAFAHGMHAHWGITTPDFPNFFFLLGPNTGLGHNSVVLMIEAQVRYALSLIAQMNAKGWHAADVRPAAEQAWNAEIQKRHTRGVWTQGGCRSWYLDAQGRNTTIWPGTVLEYQRRTRRARLEDYAPVGPAPAESRNTAPAVSTA